MMTSKRALEVVAAAVALVSAGCINPPGPNPQPGCTSGTGTLAYMNNTSETVNVDLADEAGPLPSFTLTAGQALSDTEPTGDYTITVTGAVTHNVLIASKKFTVACDANTMVTIAAEAPLALSVSITGSGQGTVTSAPAGISCSTGAGTGTGTCSVDYVPATPVVLTATVGTNSKFTSWGGACSGTATTCTVTISQAQSVTAQFDTTVVGGPHLSYYGGPVVKNPKLVMVNWTASVDSTTRSQLPNFLQAVPSSTGWVNVLSQYTDTTGGSIHASTWGGVFTITPSNTATTIDDSALQTELLAQINSGHLPANDANTVYIIAMPAGYKVTVQGSASCQQFCGYHGTVATSAASGGYFSYVVLSDVGHDGCELGCGSAATTFDNLTSLATNELANTLTDPEVGLSQSYGPPLAWFDPQGQDGEISDICNAQQTSYTVNGTTWTVQKVWSNSAASCVGF